MKFKATETISKFSMLSEDDPILVGISGGADSVALLHFLKNYEPFRLNVLACHINHNIRDEESKRDEQFVRDICHDMEVSLFVRHANVPLLSKELRCSIEEAARQARYQTFEKLATALNSKIATAHTLNDSIETVMLNIARGTGLKGLCGIAPIRGQIVRPFVFVARSQIEKYLNDHGLNYIHDSSNDNLEYSRNYIRHKIVPMFFSLNPSFEIVFERMCEKLSEDENFLQELANDKLLKLTSGPNFFYTHTIKNLPDSVRFRILRKILFDAGIMCDAKKIELIKQAIILGRGKVMLSSRNFCLIKSGKLSIEEVLPQTIIAEFEQPVKIPGKYYACDGQALRLELITRVEFELLQSRQDLRLMTLDYEKIVGLPKVRGRKPGDSIRLNRTNCRKTIKKLFNEHKVPYDTRARCIMLEDKNGLIWVNGFGPDKRVAVTHDTEQVVILEVEG